uniref:Uncharacterized protein n=2 Tax=Magallana gigas TaxID=29159 RepID=A0A8W8NU87_MAGGI
MILRLNTSVTPCSPAEWTCVYLEARGSHQDWETSPYFVHFRDDGLYQLNCDYEVGDEYGAPDPPFFIHIGDTWRRCTCMVYGDRERSTLETFVYVCCVVVS